LGPIEYRRAHEALDELALEQQGGQHKPESPGRWPSASPGQRRRDG